MDWTMDWTMDCDMDSDMDCLTRTAGCANEPHKHLDA